MAVLFIVAGVVIHPGQAWVLSCRRLFVSPSCGKTSVWDLISCVYVIADLGIMIKAGPVSQSPLLSLVAIFIVAKNVFPLWGLHPYRIC